MLKWEAVKLLKTASEITSCLKCQSQWTISLLETPALFWNMSLNTGIMLCICRHRRPQFHTIFLSLFGVTFHFSCFLDGDRNHFCDPPSRTQFLQGGSEWPYNASLIPKLIRQKCLWNLIYRKGRAIAQAVSRRLRTAAARVQTRVWSCGILWWTIVALGQVFSENFGFPCQSTFHLLLQIHLHYHSRLAQ
jgi:hypothetical protein